MQPCSHPGSYPCLLRHPNNGLHVWLAEPLGLYGTWCDKLFFLWFYSFYFGTHVYVGAGVCAMADVWRSGKNLSLFLPPIMWVPGIKLRFVRDFTTEPSHRSLVRQLLVCEDAGPVHTWTFFPITSFTDKCT